MTRSKTQAVLQASTEDNDYLQRRTRALRKIRQCIENAVPYTSKFNEREIMSVKAVVAYQAYTHQLSEETVLSFLTTAFDVKAIEDFDRDLYDNVIRFLVDYNFEAAFN